MTAVRRLRAGPSPGQRRTAVDAAVRALEGGSILAHPTETVYGLGAGPTGRDRTICEMKGREPEHRLLRLGADVGAVRRAHPELRWSPLTERLASRFWPGPLTLVLPDGSGDGLGVRVEGHPLTRDVLAVWGGTMSSTSLNRTGREPARSPEEVATALDAMPDVDVEVVWLDAGELPPSAPSTVLSLVGAEPRLLREGALPASRLEACLRDQELARG